MRSRVWVRSAGPTLASGLAFSHGTAGCLAGCQTLVSACGVAGACMVLTASRVLAHGQACIKCGSPCRP